MKTREIVDLVEELRQQGWRVEETNSGPGHYSAYPPDKTLRPIHFSGSGCRRALPNVIAKLRRSGFRSAAA